MITFYIGGVFTVNDEFPWHAAIYVKNASRKFNYVCGGVLIYPDVVLTAAHCLRGIQPNGNVYLTQW